MDAESHDWRDDAPPGWDQEAPVATLRGPAVHSALIPCQPLSDHAPRDDHGYSECCLVSYPLTFSFTGDRHWWCLAVWVFSVRRQMDAESHDWRDDVPPGWDQEVPVAASQGLPDALGSYSVVLDERNAHADAQFYSGRFLSSDFVRKSRPRIAESPLFAKVLSSARKRLAAPGSARSVAHPGPESDHSVMGRPVGDLIPSPPIPFPAVGDLRGPAVFRPLQLFFSHSVHTPVSV